MNNFRTYGNTAVALVLSMRLEDAKYWETVLPWRRAYILEEMAAAHAELTRRVEDVLQRYREVQP